MYTQESALVDEFVSVLPTSSFAESGKLRIAKEFNYNRGRTDVIILTDKGDVIAFEAKLEKWREALHQAYRNTCFAHYSYVLLPKNVAEKAVQYEAEFRDRCVGLCYLAEGELIIAREANKNLPLQQWLLNKAVEVLGGDDTANGRGNRSN
jgi:hypothetical protein